MTVRPLAGECTMVSTIEGALYQISENGRQELYTERYKTLLSKHTSGDGSEIAMCSPRCW